MMTDAVAKKIYETNTNAKEYINRLATKHGDNLPPSHYLSLALVKEVLAYYMDLERGM